MSERTREARALDALVAEAKEHLVVGTEPDWARLESRVMSAVDAEKPALLREVERSARGRVLRSVGVLVACAAGVLLWLRADRDAPLPSETPAVATHAEASSLRESVGGGDIRVGSLSLTPGAVVHAGDTIEADRTRAIFERPSKVTWLIEHDRAGAVARANVKSAGESLVLGLDDGAIEAQVVPVPSGEAFAVDVSSGAHLVRVAVHGTHLRVARTGAHVVVDLTEGVVSIGVPPRTGVTLGTLVTAPAHVEFDVTDLASLRVDHSAASVLAAVPLGRQEAAVRTESVPRAESGIQVASSSESLAASERSERAEDPLAAKKSAKPGQPKPVPAAAAPPRASALAIVRDCAAGRSRSGDVHVTVTSELRLQVSAEGKVESAQFVPPLSPEVQSCAAQSLYKLRFEESGVVTVPIEFSY